MPTESQIWVGTPVTVFKGFSYAPATATFPNTGGVVSIKYRTTSSSAVATETVVLSQIELDLTKGYAETIIPDSVRFSIGSSTYVCRGGQIYRNPSVENGSGALSGTLDISSGRARISSWTATTNSAILHSMTTSMDLRTVETCVFRMPTAPIKAGSMQLRFTTVTGATKIKTIPESGLLQDNDCIVIMNYPHGVILVKFGLVKNYADLTLEEKAQPWYDPEYIFTEADVQKYWVPRPVLSASILYNAVAHSMLPPDSALLGINAARLPPDGKALIFNTGRLVLIHHTDTITETALSPSQVIDCGRVRLYRVAIDDTDGQRLPDSFFTVDRITGLVTMSPSLDLTGYSGPYAVKHTVADLARLVATDINGTLSLNKALSHTFPAYESRVSGMLYIGTMQARYSNLFAQAAWTGEWSDERIGDAPLAQYNDALYPIIVANIGAYTDRILVRFTSSTAYQVIGENLGLIGTGDINTNCSPTNSLTGQSYCTIDYRGWGGGWATGNCLRFNIIGASWPIDLIRAIQPSNPTGEDVSTVELLLIGNIDNP